MGLGQFFENKNVKIILGIAAVISLLMLINKLFSKSEEELNNEKALKSRRGTYKDVPPSYPDYVYQDYADSLQDALAVDLTEDEETVYSIFSAMKNISDVNKLIEFYGKRRLASSIGGRSLPETISKLFNPSEKAKLNGILRKKGINYKFG